LDIGEVHGLLFLGQTGAEHQAVVKALCMRSLSSRPLEVVRIMAPGQWRWEEVDGLEFHNGKGAAAGLSVSKAEAPEFVRLSARAALHVDSLGGEEEEDEEQQLTRVPDFMRVELLPQGLCQRVSSYELRASCSGVAGDPLSGKLVEFLFSVPPGGDPFVPPGAAGLRLGAPGAGGVLACWVGAEAGRPADLPCERVRVSARWGQEPLLVTEARLVEAW
jgi:hypothetical protein